MYCKSSMKAPFSSIRTLPPLSPFFFFFFFLILQFMPQSCLNVSKINIDFFTSIDACTWYDLNYMQ